MNEYYWELVTKDDTVYQIPPAVVEVVQRRMGNKDPINLSTASIPFSEIKKFQQTDKPYGQQPLLEAAAQAFREPVYNPDGSMASRWVKKNVPNQQYTKHYSHIPAYRSLGIENGMVVVAFRLPIHEINMEKVQYCTDNELTSLK